MLKLITMDAACLASIVKQLNAAVWLYCTYIYVAYIELKKAYTIVQKTAGQTGLLAR